MKYNEEHKWIVDYQGKGATNNIVTFNCHHNERHLGRRGQHTPFDYGMW